MTDLAQSQIEEDGIFVALTNDTLDPKAIMDKVRSPKCGAIVLFAGRLQISNLPV